MVIHPAKFLDEVHVFERNISDVCLRHAHVCWSNFCWWNIIYIYMWGWVKTYHYHGRVSTSWTFMNQLCKGSRVPRFWPIASHNNTRPSTAGRTLGCRSGTASGDGIRFALLWGGTGRFPRHGTLLMCGRLESGWEGWWFMAMDMICYIYININ